MAHTCRGTISLHGALIHTVDACTFVVSNGGTQTFHIKAATEVERQQWVTALELAKAKAIQAMESGLFSIPCWQDLYKIRLLEGCMYIPNKNFDSIGILVLRDKTKIWKKTVILKMSRTSSHNDNT